MEKLKLILLGLLIISLLSCEDDKVVNMDLLQEYELFMYTSEVSFPDDLIKIDTILYWFSSEDSVIAYRKFYEQTAFGLPELVKQDTTGRDYFINGNMVHFGFFNDEPVLYESDYLLDLSWKVIKIDEDQLNIKLYSGDLYAGNVKLKSLIK